MLRFIKIIVAVLGIAAIGLIGIYYEYPTETRKGIVDVLIYIHPDKVVLDNVLKSKADKLIEAASLEGIDVRIISTVRSMDKQAKLYAQGRTTKGSIITNAPPGMSYHNYGWAVDVCIYKNGKPDWRSKYWNRIGEIGVEQGLIWGGNWTRLVDKPHFQLSLLDIVKSKLEVY